MAMEEGGTGLELGLCKETEARTWTDCVVTGCAWLLLKGTAFLRNKRWASHCQSLTQTRCPPRLLSFTCLFLPPTVCIGGGHWAETWRYTVDSRCSLPSKSFGFSRGPSAQTTGREVLQQKPERCRAFHRRVDVREEMLTSAGRRRAGRGFTPGLTEDWGRRLSFTLSCEIRRQSSSDPNAQPGNSSSRSSPVSGLPRAVSRLLSPALKERKWKWNLFILLLLRR